MLKEKIYEGISKNFYIRQKKSPKYYPIFKDDATAFNNVKKDHLEGKGILNNIISTI